jgi:hypothetical protein
MPTASELEINTDASAMQMAESMFGSGVEVKTASYTGAETASGIYSGADTTSPGLAPSDSGVILSTGNAESVTNSSGDVNTASDTTTNHGGAGDADLTEIAGVRTYDASVFEAEFVPEGSYLTMQITFSSEEYLDWVDSGYNDAVGVFVNGEKAQLSIGDGDISIDNINNEDNSNLFVDNNANGDLINTEMDGVTITMTLKAPVNPGEVNTIKIGIAHAGDSAYDSNLMIAADSVQTSLIANDDEIEVAEDYAKTVDLLDNDTTTSGGELTITAINGVPVAAGDTLILDTGEEITLNADGTVTVESTGEGGPNSFSYTVSDEDGVTDTAFVTMTTTAPCFTAGITIATPDGLIPVEDLTAGDVVLTRDNGAKPLLWVGHSIRAARDNDAPVRFEENALGAHDAQELSPNHRVLLSSAQAMLLFGESEILVKAKDLINDTTIRLRSDGEPVHYVHLLFDQHEIVYGNGLPSESYQPGDQTLASFDPATLAEVERLFSETGIGNYGPSARLSLKGWESAVLMDTLQGDPAPRK